MTVSGSKTHRPAIVRQQEEFGVAIRATNVNAKTTGYVLWEATVPPIPVSNAFAPVIPSLSEHSVTIVTPDLTPLTPPNVRVYVWIIIMEVNAMLYVYLMQRSTTLKTV
tara:strand:+ start:149 stop:475 length:327 start_codon:yes stop_codon:yes gene_type:complete